eukprot:TRINITY_DN23494_c0_g5_i1.p1 TRINITY_DN23494_c0_g5~~TRINITY_DN23494_c0_g5_i1.p1  ORF type:complete len:391 (+),score=130.43 TRINITY_DN23494_c0_g5_i1:93-1265(+)
MEIDADSLYGNLLTGGAGPSSGAKKAKSKGDDMFSEPKAAAAAAAPVEKKEERSPPSTFPQSTFSAAKLMMPPVRKKAEPKAKTPLPAFNIAKLQEEKEALMRQRQQAEQKKEAPTPVSVFSAPSFVSGSGGATASSAPAASAAPAAGAAGSTTGSTEVSAVALAALYGNPDEEYDPAKPNDYDEFCRRRMRQKAEEEMERRRQEVLNRQNQAAKPEEPKEDDFATKMMKKMGWKEGSGLGKDGQGMAAPLIMQKTDQRAGKIVEGAKREATAQPAGQPDPKAAKAAAPARPPTRVLLLNNLVGKGDVDEDLEEETGEEAGKYGKLKRCVIKELNHLGDNEAVRIFLEYEQISAATKAFADMNGRFFGGRVVKARFYDEALFAKGDLEAD